MSFSDKKMTSYAGFSLIAKLFEKINLEENINKIMPIKETSPNSKGIYSKILKFGLTVLAGGERFSHSIYLSDSIAIFKELFNVKDMVKSISAITRLFNKINNQKLSELFSEALWNYMFEKIILFKEVPADYINFDSKVITRYGGQEGAFKGYNSKKKGRPSHHPIMAFLNKEKYVLNLWNRSGNASSANNIVDFANQTFLRINDKVTVKGCLADSGFYLIEFIKLLELKKYLYIIGVPLSQIIQFAVYEIKNWQLIEPGIEIGEFNFKHKDDKWDKERRYVVVRQEIEKRDQAKGKQLSMFKEDEEMLKYRFGCYITSFDIAAVDVWRQYRLRANDENIIKENTYGFALEGFALENFYATEASMLIRCLFYNIINFFRKEILTEKESHETLPTLRYKFLAVPGILGTDGRDKILRIGIKNDSMRQKFKWIISRIDLYFAKCNAFG